MNKLPKEFQGILWSKNIENFDLERDKVYIIHQVLALGSLGRIERLFRLYPRETIVQTFQNSPKKIYSAPVFYFVKNFILGLSGVDTPKEKYVRTSLGNIKRTAAKSA